MSKTRLLVGVLIALGLTAFLLTRTCGDRRDVTGLETALLGHWSAQNGDQIYYGPDMAVAVDADGTRSYHPYRVLMCNERQSWLKILIDNGEGEPVARVLRFSEDRREYATFVPMLTDQGRTLRETRATYQDDALRP